MARTTALRATRSRSLIVDFAQNRETLDDLYERSHAVFAAAEASCSTRGPNYGRRWSAAADTHGLPTLKAQEAAEQQRGRDILDAIAATPARGIDDVLTKLRFLTGERVGHLEPGKVGKYFHHRSEWRTDGAIFQSVIDDCERLAGEQP
jgi:hypothetical protein